MLTNKVFVEGVVVFTFEGAQSIEGSIFFQESKVIKGQTVPPHPLSSNGSSYESLRYLFRSK
jgi:hypothetical protein